MRHRFLILAATTTFAGCSNQLAVECEVSSNCNLTGGGVCVKAPSGNLWCAYDDPGCPSGLQYAGDVGDGLARSCVPAGTGTDSGADTPLPAPKGWAKAFGSTGRDTFNGMDLGSNGDIVAVGSFEGSATFGGASLSSEGERDAVVVKLDATGKHLWSKAFGGPLYDDVIAVTVDQAGNVYALGRFTGSIDVDGMTLTTKGSATNGGFVAKLDGATGGRLWAFEFGVVDASEFQQPDAIALSADGTKLAISGQFYGTANFGGANITHAGAGDVFVSVHATTDGAHLWSRGFGGTGIDEASGVAFDGNDGVIIAGTYSGPASFGGTQPLSGHDNFPAGDVFVARYAAGNGAFVWANGYGSNGADHAYKVRVAGGAAFVAGSFSPATPGAGILLGGDLLSSAGGTDGFVAKYDVATGSHIWSKPIGGPSEDRVLDLTMADQIWVTLSFSGATKIGNTNYTSSGISDVAFGSLSLSTGATGTSGAFGGPDVDDGTAIAVNSTALCIAGWFVGSTTLIYGNPLPGTGMTDAFIGCATP